MPHCTAEEREECSGLYWEEVGKIVDEFEVAILGGEYANREAVTDRLDEVVPLSEWVCDQAGWAIDTLLFSKHACAAVTDSCPPKRNRDDAFPFGHYAESAMKADCLDELRKREAFQRLPSTRNAEVELKVARLVAMAERKGMTAENLASVTGVEPDRLNNGGLSEVVRLLLADDDSDWLEAVISVWQRRPHG